MSRTRAQHDAEQLELRGPPAMREFLLESGWHVTDDEARHQLWGRHCLLGALLMNNQHRRSLAALSAHGLVHGGGVAEC